MSHNPVVTTLGTAKTSDDARMQVLDVARLIAAVGVVAAHVINEFFPGDPAWVFGSYAVPFYLFVALYFTVRGFATRPERGVGSYLWGRTKKLYLPFLLWNVIYDLLHVWHHPGSGFTPPYELVWAAVYTHLYFLPFLFAVTAVLCVFIRPLLNSNVMRGIAVSGVAIAAVVVACLPQPTSLDDPQHIVGETLWNFDRAIPPALLAIAFAFVAGRQKRPMRTSSLVALFGGAMIIGCLATEYRFGQQGLLRAGSGFGLVLIAFSSIRARWLKPLAVLGRLSFGVYLSHVLVIRLVMILVERRNLEHDPMAALLVGASALIGGLVISAALASTKWTRWTIGCETPAPRRMAQISASTAIKPAEPLAV